LTYQLVCWTTWNDVKSGTKGGTLRNVITHHVIWTNQKTVSFLFLPIWTCNVWRYMLSRICQSIERHFKRSFDTSIARNNIKACYHSLQYNTKHINLCPQAVFSCLGWIRIKLPTRRPRRGDHRNLLQRTALCVCSNVSTVMIVSKMKELCLITNFKLIIMKPLCYHFKNFSWVSYICDKNLWALPLLDHQWLNRCYSCCPPNISLGMKEPTKGSY